MKYKLLTKEELKERTNQFCDLYHSCFNDKIDSSVIVQRYLQNPVDDLFMYVAMEDERIVANYSVAPAFLQYDNEMVKCALSLNTMTHPEFVGKGLFVKLASALYDELRDKGYGMVYGFPNYISNRTFCNKLNWKDIYEIPTLELVITQAIPYNKSNVLLSSEYEIEQISESRLHVYKSKEYLFWRYKNKPYSRYFCIKTRNGGWAIYKRYQNMINIVELHAQSETVIVDLIGFIIDVVIQDGLEKMTVWSSVNSMTHLILEKMGFRNRYPITYFGAVDLGIGQRINLDIWDFRNWSINMGDDNVY